MDEVSAVRPAREKLHIVLFVIGLTMLVSGVAVAIEGPNIWVKWHPKSGALLEDAILDIVKRAMIDDHWESGRDTYPWQYPIEIEISREAADIRVEGNITEIDGYRFYFVALDGHHHHFWYWGGDTTGAYVDIRNVTECSFAFNLTNEQLSSQVRFGVENRNTFWISTRLSAMIYWKEKEVIEPTIATIGLFTIAKLIAVLGFILLIAAAVLKVRKLDERPYRAADF